MIKNLLKRLFRPFFRNYHLTQWAKTITSSRRERKGIVSDYKRLYKIKGLTTDEYRDFEFDKQSEEFRQSFLGLNEQRFYLDYLNPVKYCSLARNKFMTHKMLEDTGVRTSVLYCYYKPEGNVFSSDMIANNVQAVCRILKQKNVSQCVVKTTESSHGDNVYVVNQIDYEENDCTFILYNGEKVRLSKLLGLNPMIFESVIKQTSQFAAFNPSSVNTVRFMTALYPDGKARLVCNFIKIGRAGHCVDNAGKGGNVDGHIDNETGVLKDMIEFHGWRQTQAITHHPDSGALLEGVKIDNWKDIVAQVLHFQECFPYCKVAGWDIAITDQGPIVIEVNDFWDRTGQLFIRRGWRNEIRECYFAWREYWYNMRNGEDITNNTIKPSSNSKGNDLQILQTKEGKEYRKFRLPNALKHSHLIRIASHE